jgi:glycosyltransferase involved in cell wall biosynthesis
LTNPTASQSWFGTNQTILRFLSERVTIANVIDLNIYDKRQTRLHQMYCWLKYGEETHRDWLHNQFVERKYRNALLSGPTPDAILQISSFCVPDRLSAIPHYAYIDATIMGQEHAGVRKMNKKLVADHVRYTRLYAEKLRLLFTFNEWTRTSLLNDFNIDERKIKTVGFGANLTPYFGPKDYSNKLILTVLRRGMERRKGLYLLLDGFRRARQQDPELRLAVVGTTLDDQDGVTWYEGFSREKTIELFEAASLFAMPALYEPNGMVFIEALACKVPILGLNRLAFPEFSGHGKYGFACDENPDSVADRILEACSAPGTLRRMGEEGQHFVLNRYTWPIVVTKILAEIQKGAAKETSTN